MHSSHKTNQENLNRLRNQKNNLLTDEKTGQELFRPKINKYKNGIRDTLDTHKSLYEKSIAKKERIALLMKAETEKISERTNKDKKAKKTDFY